jgi:hypothetical protein
LLIWLLGPSEASSKSPDVDAARGNSAEFKLPALALPAEPKLATSRALWAVVDKSLSSDRYVKLGLPSYGRVWNSRDMTEAATHLEELFEEHPDQLPRFRSSKSGAMFARIVAPENLKPFRSESLPPGVRFNVMFKYGNELRAIARIYLSARMTRRVSEDDLTEMCGAILELNVVTLDVLDELLATRSRYSRVLAARTDLLRRLAEVTAEALRYLTNERRNSPDARQRLLARLRKTLPHIVPQFTAPCRVEVLLRLDRIAADPKLKRLQPDLTALRDEVRAQASTRQEEPVD